MNAETNGIIILFENISLTIINTTFRNNIVTLGMLYLNQNILLNTYNTTFEENNAISGAGIFSAKNNNLLFSDLIVIN